MYFKVLTDEAHIKAIAEGSQTAFVALYHTFSARVYNTALSYMQQVEDAEEVTQDVFTKIHKNASQFKGASSVSTWVYRITVNAALNQLRKKKRFAFIHFMETVTEKASFEHPGVLLEKKEAAKQLFQVIETLPEQQKTAFILSFVEDLPRQEVADIMETSLKAVEALLQRAKKNLRLKLAKPTL